MHDIMRRHRRSSSRTMVRTRLVIVSMILASTTAFSPTTSRFPPTLQHAKPTLLQQQQQRPQQQQSRIIITHKSNRPSFSTKLAAATLQAVTSLSFAALLGVTMDRRVADSGILVALFTSAILANTGLAPTVHPVYDLCWKIFLPGSLALLLLSMKKDKNANSKSTNISTIDPETTVARSITRVAMPFFIVSTASVIGCVLAFLFSYNGISALQKFNLLLSPYQALVACSCLVASYVGGSVNFMATASTIMASNDLVSSMAAADLVLMAFYFALLSAALQSPFMNSLFLDDKGQNDNAGNDDDTLDIESSIPSLTETTKKDSSLTSIPGKILLGTGITGLALAIVQFSNQVEAILAPIVPGTACAVITIIAPAIVQLMPSQLKAWQATQSVAKPLSEFFFLLLFASIGMSADLSAALRVGPACFFATGVALTTHIVLSLLGCLVARKTFFRSMRLEDVLIASNAAIGGPATAAAFCGRISDSNPRQKGLTMAASFWGVFGYAIGTTLGVSTFRVLKNIYF